MSVIKRATLEQITFIQNAIHRLEPYTSGKEVSFYDGYAAHRNAPREGPPGAMPMAPDPNTYCDSNVIKKIQRDLHWVLRRMKLGKSVKVRAMFYFCFSIRKVYHKIRRVYYFDTKLITLVGHVVHESDPIFSELKRIIRFVNKRAECLKKLIQELDEFDKKYG